MENKNEQNTAGSGILAFDPIVLVRDVAKRWLLIILAALIVGMGAYVFKDLTYKPQYQSRITYVTYSRNSASTVYTNLSSANSVASVFSELLNSSILRKTIQQESGIDYFSGTINAAVIPETNLINVTVTASDARTAFLVAKALVEHHEEITYRVVDNVSLEVLQSPVVSSVPINYSGAANAMKKMTILAAVAMVAVLGYLSYTRDTVRSAKEARAKLDCNYLGEILHENKYKTLISRIRRRKTSILITNPITGLRFVESIRKLCSRVEHRMGEGKVLMVTSLLENEGKSTVAVNLAIAMAQKHENVLLIDCDLRKPACYALLEQKDVTNGLYEVLTGKANLADTLRRERKSNLHLLLEKRVVKNSGDLLASESMRRLLEWARNNFDYVILDLPPMAEVSDAESVMELADASLLVVRQNAAPTPIINKAVDALSSGKAELLGCVLNNVYTTAMASGRGYGYGYGDGYGYSRYGHYGKYGKYNYRK